MSEFQNISLSALAESKSNPRKTAGFEKESLAELAASIKTHGILNPLIVRSVSDGPEKDFEIVAGARRFRAAKLAGLTKVPVRVQSMSDEQVLEVQTIENLQRADVHPLDEADGYRRLAKTLPVEKIAAAVGKERRYVSDRLRLLNLSPQARAVFAEGLVSVEHANVLAQISAADQDRAVKDALFVAERTLYNPMTGEGGFAGDAKKERGKPISPRELRAWVDQHVRFRLDKQEALDELFPETAQALALAAGGGEKLKVVSITQEHYTQPETRDPKERTYGPRSWALATGGSSKSKTCEKSVLGVIVMGPGRGESFKVCVDKTCKVHWDTPARRKEKAARALAPASKDAGGGYDFKKEEEKARKENERRDRARRRWAKAAPKVLAALAEKLAKASVAPGSPVEQTLWKMVLRRQYDDRGKAKLPPAIEKAAPKGRKPEDLLRRLVFAAAGLEVLDDWRGYEYGPRAAKLFGLDVASILAEIPEEEAVEKSADVKKVTA